MSIVLIQSALEKKLAALAGALPTAYENEVFVPVTGQPYQKVFLLVNTPVDYALTADMVEQRGLFQVTLLFPLGTGRGAAQSRAQAIATHFKPVQVLTEGAVKVQINSTPRIGDGMVDDDRWAVPVKVLWRSFSA